MLRRYSAETEDILQKAVLVPERERSKLISQDELQHKSWAAKIIALKSHLTQDQLRILDGKISEYEHQIDQYCERTAKELEAFGVPEDITEGATSSLQTRLLDFMRSEAETVLLLQAPAGAHKTHASKFLAYKAWRELNWIPVVVDLRQLKNIDHECIAKTLGSHKLDDAAILHAQATRRFLLVIEGFDKCNCQVNVYVRSRFVLLFSFSLLHFVFFFFFFFFFVLLCQLTILCSLKNWRGKAVFTCRSSYIGNIAQGPFYFMPADAHQRPQPQALRIISFATAYSALPSDDDETTSNPGMLLIISFLIVF